MPKIKNLDWEVEVNLQRAEVKAMARLGDFIGNIESMMKKDFPTDHKKIDWQRVRGSFHEFSRAENTDDKFVKDLTETLKGMED